MKFLFYLLLAIELKSAKAEVCVCDAPNCSQAKTASEIIAAVGCPPENELFLKDAQEEHFRLFGRSNASRTKEILGKTVEGTNEELKIAEELLGKVPPQIWRTNSANCKSVICALTAVYGSEESALRALIVAKKFGYNLSADQQANSGNGEYVFTTAQMRGMHKELERLPSKVHNMNELKTYYPLSESARKDFLEKNPLLKVKQFAGVFFRGTKNIYMVESKSLDAFLITFVHETAHAYEDEIKKKGATTFKDFESLSGWIEPTRTSDGAVSSAVYDSKAQFVTDYAKRDSGEDFAETLANFVRAPSNLLTKANVKYDFMKNSVFDGEDYRRKELDSWPALKEALDSLGGVDHVLTSCLDGLKATYGSKSDPVFIGSNEKNGTTYRLDNFLKSENFRCNQSLSKQLLNKLSKDPKFCIHGGQKFVERVIDDLIKSDLSLAMTIANEFAKDPKLDCVNGNETKLQCLASHVSKQVGQTPRGTESIKGSVIRLLSKHPNFSK